MIILWLAIYIIDIDVNVEGKTDMTEFIILSAKIFTGDPANPMAEAVYIKGNQIAAVGTTIMVKKSAPCDVKVLDLPGCLITPGLIEGHCHFTSIGVLLQNLNFRDITSISSCRQMVKQAVLKTKPGEWIIGRGWNENLWEENREPVKQDLDDIAPDNPVYLTRVCGHSVWVNSKALEIADITARTQDSPGGKIDKDPVTCEPTGIIRETLELISAHIPPKTKQQLRQAALTAQKEVLRFGITCVHSLEDLDSFKAVRELDRDEELKVRVYHSLHVEDIKEAEREGFEINQNSEHLWLGHVKLYADGSLGANTALLHDPYDDQPGNLGLAFLDPESLKAGVEFAYERGYGVMIHAIGDKAVTNSLESIADARKKYPCQPRDRIEHVQLFRPRDLQLFKDHNITASVQPVFLATDRFSAEKKWGIERCRNSYAWRTLMDKKIPLQFGSDAPVEPVNPVLGIFTAVERKNYKYKTHDKWFPEQSLTLEEAIIGFTRQAAFTSGKENELGIIAPGKLADLTIFNQDFFCVPKDQWPEIEVNMTIINGEIVYEKSVILKDL